MNLLHVLSKSNLADILTKPLGPQAYGLLLHLFSFLLVPHMKHEGECQTGKNEDENLGLDPKIGTLDPGAGSSLVIGVSGWGM